MKDRPNRLGLDGGSVRLAHLTENLALTQHQAFNAGGDPKQVAHNALVVVADQMSREEVGANLVEIGQKVAERIGLGNRLGTSGQVDLDAVAGREDHDLSLWKRTGKRSERPRSFRAVAGQRLADAGRRGAVIDTQSEQSHGVLPAVRPTPWAVGSWSASIPTQVKTRKAKATIVSTTTLRPRRAGRNRACKSTAKTSHMPRALRTFGSVQRSATPVPEARPG